MYKISKTTRYIFSVSKKNVSSALCDKIKEYITQKTKQKSFDINYGENDKDIVVSRTDAEFSEHIIRDIDKQIPTWIEEIKENEIKDEIDTLIEQRKFLENYTLPEKRESENILSPLYKVLNGLLDDLINSTRKNKCVSSSTMKDITDLTELYNLIETYKNGEKIFRFYRSLDTYTRDLIPDDLRAWIIKGR